MTPSLAGRWTLAQVRALRAAGWLDGWNTIDVTTPSDCCRWYTLAPPIELGKRYFVN